MRVPMGFDVAAVRRAFPILGRSVPNGNGAANPLRYFDHAASTHAPRPVVEAVRVFVEEGYANVHRGNHHLSRVATDAFEAARAELLASLGGRPDHGTVVFTHNTTGALELAAHVMTHVRGDTVITHLEHHSNDLPHRRRGRVHRVDPEGDVATLPERIEKVLEERDVKLVAVTGASNVTGECPDVHEIARVAHARGAKILVDAAQLYAHGRLDVKDPEADDHLDFVAAAGHKSYAPFGSAVLYGPRGLFDAAPPWTPGGGTVLFVGRDDVAFDQSPERHEAGTPNVPGAVAFAAASRWLSGLGRDAVAKHEAELAAYARGKLADVDGLTAYEVGGAPRRLGVFPVTLEGWDHAALSAALDEGWGIATRDGCFCAHPLMIDLLGVQDDVAEIRRRMVAGETDHVPGLVRASLGVYNTRQEIDVLAEALSELSGTKPKAKHLAATPSGEAS